LFTSPHLSAVEERIQVNGQPITHDELAVLMEEIEPAGETMARQGGGPTFFEVGTALGFLHFFRRRCEIAVIEVGLGGRFDSTNVCQPLVSVITSISYDHTQILGEKLAQIAFEKAGIIKPGIPCVSGVTAPEAADVIEQVSHDRRAPLIRLGHEFRYRHLPGRWANDPECPWERRPTLQVSTDHEWPMMELSLVGDHQAANASVVVAVVDRLREQGLTLPDQAVADGLQAVVWPARLEIMGTRPLLILDCAHNIASAQALGESLQASAPPERPWVLVFAASSDKDHPGMLEALAGIFDRVIFTRYLTNPRSVPPERLAAIWSQLTPKPVEMCDDPIEACQRAIAQAGSTGLVCVTGSVFLAGELRPHLGKP
jgi:dihydrofolate synthase/folylpolyglutamate synthase